MKPGEKSGWTHSGSLIIEALPDDDKGIFVAHHVGGMIAAHSVELYGSAVDRSGIKVRDMVEGEVDLSSVAAPTEEPGVYAIPHGVSAAFKTSDGGEKIVSGPAEIREYASVDSADERVVAEVAAVGPPSSRTM